MIDFDPISAAAARKAVDDGIYGTRAHARLEENMRAGVVVTSTTAELIAEARQAVAYLDSFDAHRLMGTPEPTVPARLAERLVQQTIADLADALEVADRALTVDWAENITAEDESAIRRHMHELAVRNMALAAPRVVSTVAELDALPLASAVISQHGYILEKLSEGWFRPGVPSPYRQTFDSWLPATLVRVGDTE